MTGAAGVVSVHVSAFIQSSQVQRCNGIMQQYGTHCHGYSNAAMEWQNLWKSQVIIWKGRLSIPYAMLPDTEELAALVQTEQSAELHGVTLFACA